MNELAGRVAIVTGAARGVGAAIVRELIARGARVAAVDNGVSIDFSRPGKTTHNAFVESFNGKVRQELLTPVAL